MTEDRFLTRLREEAQHLRYEAVDDAVWTRLPARIEDRIRQHPPIAQLLAHWFRPLAGGVTALALVAGISLSWIEQSHEPTTVEAVMSASAPAADMTAIDGEIAGVE